MKGRERESTGEKDSLKNRMRKQRGRGDKKYGGKGDKKKKRQKRREGERKVIKIFSLFLL